MLAIIGGSGLTRLANLEIYRREVVPTPFGDPSGALTFGRLGEADVVFLPRHGDGHTIPPHLINYRANLWAITNAAKADRIVSIAAVGGIRPHLVPGTLVVPHQIIDYTWGRASSFFEDGENPVVHVDFTHPYDAALRAELLRVAVCVNEVAVDGAVYAITQGPRLETAAEVNRLDRDGADIIGMTGMPEAALARELKVPYAALCVVANWAAGRAESSQAICFEDMEAVLHESLARVRRIVEGYCSK